MTNVHMRMVVSLNRVAESTVGAARWPSIADCNGDDNIGDGLNAAATGTPERRADDFVMKTSKRKLSDVNSSKPMT